MKTIIQILIFTSLFSKVSLGQNDQIKRHLIRAETAIKLEQFVDAVNEYKAALTLDPGNANIYYNLASIQEKIGTYETLSEAIGNLKKYLKLAPNDNDYDKIENKIISLEFQIEKQAKGIKQFEILKGTWRSNWYYKESGVPFWFFNLEKFNGDLRITVLPKSGLFRSDFTYQTITIPYTGESLSFTFTNDTKFQPSNIETTVQHSIVDAAGTGQTAAALSPLLHGLIDMSAKQPFQSICTYIFKLNLSPDSLYGTCQSIVRRIDANSDKIIKDEVLNVSFTKNDQNYPAMTKEEIKESKRKKRKSIPSCRIYYSIPIGSTSSTDATNKNSGFFSKGAGFGFSWKTPSIRKIDSSKINNTPKFQSSAPEKNTGACINLSTYYYKLCAPYGLKITGGYPKTNLAKYADIITGETNGSNIGLDCTLGTFGYFGINNKTFYSYTICPIGFGYELFLTKGDVSYKMPSIFQLSYHGALSFALNFKNKGHTSQGILLGYNWGIPVFTPLGKEESDQNANIYHQPKPKIWKHLLNIGFEYTF